MGRSEVDKHYGRRCRLLGNIHLWACHFGSGSGADLLAGRSLFGLFGLHLAEFATKEIMAGCCGLSMLNPESNRETRGTSRAVGSQAPDSGRYQHSACTKIEIFNKGAIVALCTNPTCPNKGANWALQEKLT
jgi:hypothetical protein